jgi:hypothetical protein
MKKLIYFIIILATTSGSLSAQIGINTTGATPHPSAILDVSSTNKGFLPPRVTTAQRIAIPTPTPANGLTVFDTDTQSLWVIQGGAWVKVASEAQEASPTYAIGDYAQGGIVFWVDADGKHGKVTTIMNIATARWSNIAELTNTSTISNGVLNTADIQAQPGHLNSAAKQCSNLDFGGFDDWYLPARNELYLIWENQYLISNTSISHGGQELDGPYWS